MCKGKMNKTTNQIRETIAMKYYFKSNGQEYLIKLDIQTGKYEIFNNYLTLIDDGHTLFQVTELNATQYCNSISSEFINEDAKLYGNLNKGV